MKRWQSIMNLAEYMTNKLKIHKDDLERILEFVNAMRPGDEDVWLEISEHNTGIGSIIAAELETVVNGMTVTVKKDFTDVENW